MVKFDIKDTNNWPAEVLAYLEGSRQTMNSMRTKLSAGEYEMMLLIQVDLGKRAQVELDRIRGAKPQMDLFGNNGHGGKS